MTRRERVTYLACAYAMVLVFLAATFAAATISHDELAAVVSGWLACGCVLMIPAEAVPPLEGTWRPR